MLKALGLFVLVVAVMAALLLSGDPISQLLNVDRLAIAALYLVVGLTVLTRVFLRDSVR